MHPSPMADTTGPLRPSWRWFMPSIMPRVSGRCQMGWYGCGGRDGLDAKGGPMRGRMLLSLAVTLLAARAADPCPELPVAPATANPFGELMLGASNVNAALGSGNLTATLSRCGEVTGLKWPGPSFYDQIAYLSSNAPDARLQPHLGALDDMGAFGGIAYRTARKRGFTWLRDDGWTHAQHYSAETSDVLVTEMTNATLGLRVTATNFILPDRDVLVNDYLVERERGSPVQSARFVFYSNFSPTLTRTAFSPVSDWALDFENDFAVVYDRREGALLHFLPASAAAFPHDFSLVNPLLAAPPRTRRGLQRAVDRLVGGLTEPGVYLALGAAPRDDGYQAGFYDAPICAHQSAFVEQLASQLGPDSADLARAGLADRKSTRLNSSHLVTSYAVFCLKKKIGSRGGGFGGRGGGGGFGGGGG